MVDCAICNEETDAKEYGICLECQQKICKVLGATVQFLDEEPYVKVTPKEKETVYNFVQALSRIASNVEYNFHAIKHHSHSTKEVEVVDIE